MPLIVVCGLPNSGKSVRILEIIDYLSNKHPTTTIKLISEDSLNFKREEAYKNSKQEKDTRGTLKSEVDRWLTKDTLVILDSLNYIKGFRYELYCIARAQSTPHCIVFMDTPLEMCKEWNKPSDNKIDLFTDKMIDELAFRFETPNNKNRWDSPLFHFKPLEMKQPRRLNEDNTTEILDFLKSDNNEEKQEETEEEIKYKYCKDLQLLEDINQALFYGKVPKPNLATQPQKLENTNFVHELDRITQNIINSILESQNIAIIGDNITVPESSEKITLVHKVTMAELRRQRRRFLKLAQTNPPAINEIGNTFVVFLNSHFNTE